MKESILSLLKLRILVLTLGEAHHAEWWKSQFLSPVGLSFLERVYPRSTFAAAVRSACRAAQSVHDANVGKGAVFHLFRLPRHTERELETALVEQSDELSIQYQPLLADQTALLAALSKLAGDLPTQRQVGPVRLSADETDLVPTMAAMYLRALSDGTRVFPYFGKGV